jgi:hypothetical protein
LGKKVANGEKKLNFGMISGWVRRKYTTTTTFKEI